MLDDFHPNIYRSEGFIMTGKNAILTIETDVHVIEVSEGCLTIDTKRFPDDCVSLTPEETEEVLKLLLQWRDGTQTVINKLPGSSRDRSREAKEI